ncbi:hypothetical protein CSUI_008741 [Cystoisospora suis]|uniref:Uncharacterized protein n=1 Tax=Cystoisospora suis TaxID=483139 RepID=A0A2C6KIP9_9APIC|nr:hypothetical protein CSUI_008741 [Cystoisospora suis]
MACFLPVCRIKSGDDGREGRKEKRELILFQPISFEVKRWLTCTMRRRQSDLPPVVLLCLLTTLQNKGET